MIDIEALKRVPLIEVLDELGISWTRTGKQIVFCARWRGDKEPSVSVEQVNGRWLWNDHGMGKGGSIVDLIMIDQGMNYVEALKWLQARLTGIPVPTRVVELPAVPAQASETKVPKNSYKVERAFETASGKSRELLRQHRGLDWETFSRAGGRLLKIQWTSGKTGWKIGWENRSGGWEVKDIRESVFSGCVGHKDISVHGPKSDTALVSESLLDGLAAAKLNRIERPFVLSLNSVKLVDRCIEWILGKRSLRVLLALDNDPPENPAGQQAAQAIEEACQAAGIRTERIFTGPEKDPCEALVARLREEQAAEIPVGPSRTVQNRSPRH